MAQSQGLRLATWGGFAAALIAAGFLCDGATEVGHHACLILGGIAAGYGFARNGRGRAHKAPGEAIATKA